MLYDKRIIFLSNSSQLYGEDDPDQDVSPDTADPEAAGDAGENASKSDSALGNVQRVSTRQWAQEIDYDPSKLFNKFFQDDIKYLLSMENLWKTRKPPKPLSWTQALAQEENSVENGPREDMQVWSVSKCAKVFSETISDLKNQLKGKNFLVWDKDDKSGLDFVTACANIRANIFSIPQKSRFDVKCKFFYLLMRNTLTHIFLFTSILIFFTAIAGNIIPAIATTNAMVAGLAVLETFHILAGNYSKCCAVYTRKKSAVSKTVLYSENFLLKANPNCYVCSPQPCVNVFVNTVSMTVKEFETEILKKQLNMIAPDVVLDSKGVLVISSEEGEMDANNEKRLSELGIVDGSILKVDDFLQNYELTVYVNQYEPKEKEDPLFKIVANVEDLKAKSEEINGKGRKADNGIEEKTKNVTLEECEEILDIDDPMEGSSSKRRKLEEDDDDDVLAIEDVLE